MNRRRFTVCSLFCAALLAATAATAQQAAATPPAPVPTAILTAKKIFVSNSTSFVRMYPDVFSGDPDRAYNQFYAALKATGKYELVADPSDADLVLELHLEYGYIPSLPGYPTFHLIVYDRKTHYVLWDCSRWIELGLQKTRDRNFDRTLTALLTDFLEIGSKPQPLSK